MDCVQFVYLVALILSPSVYFMFRFLNLNKPDSKTQRIALVTHLTIVALAINLVFWFVNIFIVANVPMGIFVGITVIGVITLFLNKRGHYRSAAIFGLLSFNLAIYSIASSETTETGLHMYLGIAAFAALVIFGYEEWYLGLSFLILSVSLFFLCFFSTFSPLPERQFTSQEITTFFMINSIAFVAVCSYMFYLTISLTYYNEQALKRSEAQIRMQNEQLIKANAELDRFVYSASHDLRAPLSSLAGLVNLAVTTKDNTELSNYLAMMEGRIKLMDKFIVDIINYSRNARLELEMAKVNLQEVVQEIIDGLRYTEGVDSISFRIQISNDSEISTDLIRLKMVLNNLISNAIRYHDKSKADRHITITAEKNHRYLNIHIEDNGQGIAQEHQDKVFNMFYKASTNSGGSGLGLYIAKEAISKMNGTIELFSQSGKGSRFTVSLPL